MKNKNVNKNAQHMLVTSHDSCLAHHSFPKCSLGGDAPFTIEVRFAYQGCDHGSFYYQEDGLDLGLKDGCPYFKHPVLGELNTPKNLKLNESCCFFLAVVFDMDNKKLVMYVNGVEISSVEVSKTGTPNTKDFYIGQNFKGFIGCVRVLSRAMTAEEVMKDNGIGFHKDDACELWTDFSGVGYKDISKNNMGLWRIGYDARCENVVNCTVLNRNGLYARGNELDYDSAFSLTGKIFPDISDGGDFYIYSLYGSGEPYFQLYLTPQDDAYYLTLNINGNVLRSKDRLQGLMWIDYAVTVDLKDGNVCLYQDGAKCAEQKYTGLKKFTKAKANIGAKYYTNKPNYSDAFVGFLDYCAEFNHVLTDEEVDSYAEDQPYLYADGLTALMYFGWGSPEDVYEDSFLIKYGDGYFSMEEGTNDVSAPTGLNWYVPDDGKAYWDSLDNHDKWEYQAKIEIYCEIVEKSTGIPLEPDLDKWPPLTKAELNMLNAMTVPGKSKENCTTIMNATFAIGLGGSIIFAGMCAAGGMAAVEFEENPYTTGAVAGFCNFFSGCWSKIATAGGLAITAAVVPVLGVIIYEILKKEPKNDSAKLEVQSVSWNHNGNPKNGSIHFHNDATKIQSPSSMTFTPDESEIRIYGVFVLPKLEVITMDIKVKNVRKDDYKGTIFLADFDGHKIAESSEISIKSNCEADVSISIDVSNIKELGFGKKSDSYRISYKESGKETCMIKCDYKLYTLLGEPISPWDSIQEEYDVDNPDYINTLMLDICLDIFAVKITSLTDDEQLINAIVDGMNNCGKLQYDKAGGSKFSVSAKRRYSEGAVRYYELFKFLKFINALLSNKESTLNCADCAVIVSSLCAIQGVQCPMTYLVNPKDKFEMDWEDQEGFACNQVQVITSGEGEWRYPFDWDGKKGMGRFSFHMVNRDNEPGMTGKTKIYDACLKVDAGEYPGKPDIKDESKKAKQPKGMAAYNDDSSFISVDPDEAYTADVYKERLAADKSTVEIYPSRYWVDYIHESMGNKLAEEDGVHQIEGILGQNEHIQEWTLLNDLCGEWDWSFTYDGESMEICCAGGGADDPVQAVANVVQRFTNPDRKDVSASYPGSCCYTITEECYVIWKNAVVYKIWGTYAKEVADYIYKA